MRRLEARVRALENRGRPRIRNLLEYSDAELWSITGISGWEGMTYEEQTKALKRLA